MMILAVSLGSVHSKHPNFSGGSLPQCWGAPGRLPAAALAGGKQHVVDRTPLTWLRFATLEDTDIWYYCIDLTISLSVLPMQKMKQQNPLIEIVIKGHSWKCCCLYDPHPALQEDEMDLWVLPVETHEHPWILWWVFLWWPVTQKILIQDPWKPAVTIQCVVAFCCTTLSSLVNCETWTCLQPTSPASERLEHPNVCRNYIHTSNGQPRRWKWFIRFHPHHHFRFLVQRPWGRQTQLIRIARFSGIKKQSPTRWYG